MNVKRYPQAVLSLCVSRIKRHRFLPYIEGLVVFSFVLQFHGLVDELVEFDGGNLNVLDPILVCVHEFGKVHGAVGRVELSMRIAGWNCPQCRDA